MAVDTSMRQLRDDRFDLAAARHLLWRTGFGADWAEVKRVQALGLDKAVDQIIDRQLPSADGDGRTLRGGGDLAAPKIDPDLVRPPTPEERRAYQRARRDNDQKVLDQFARRRFEMRRADRRAYHALQAWWIERLMRAPAALEENLTLFWHGHFATGYQQVRDAYLMLKQHQTLRRFGGESFAHLARAIVRDPAMIRYLNNDRNNKRQPNENLARELMELFTIGEGQYRERDIKEGARALTGYSIDDNDFHFRSFQHDPNPKAILGRRGQFDGDDFVNILLSRSACPQFIALKLYDHFVMDVGDVAANVPRELTPAVRGLAEVLAQNRYAIRPTLRTLLKSRHFYDAAVVGRKIKSPIALLAGTTRMLGAFGGEAGVVRRSLHLMGQVPFDPPSVDGWDGGRKWINTSTLFARQNLCAYLLRGRRGDDDRAGLGGNASFNPLAVLATMPEGDRRDKVKVAHHCIDLMLGPGTPRARREPIVEFMKQRRLGVNGMTVAGLLLVITATPEYQLC